MPDKDDTGLIVVPDTAVIVVRSDEEIAKAVMAAGPSFGKIHKNHHRDHFILRNNGK
jgi:hypothetical protein